MSQAYSKDLRERVLNGADVGASVRSAAARFGIGGCQGDCLHQACP